MKKSRSSTLYPCALICLPLLYSLHPAPGLMLFCSPLCWFSILPLSTLLSPGVLLCSFSTKGTIRSQWGFGDCHLSAGVQDEKRDQSSSVKWGTEVTWASKPPQVLRNSSVPRAVEGPPKSSPPVSPRLSPAWCHGARQHHGSSQPPTRADQEKVLPVGLVAALQNRCHYPFSCLGWQRRMNKTKAPLALGKGVLFFFFSPLPECPQI